MSMEKQGADVRPVDLPRLVARSGEQRIAWTATSNDLNVNLIVLRRGERIELHRNDEVDVLIVGIDGVGEITIDDSNSRITPDTAIIVPRGTIRGILALASPFAYLTCHQQRKQLWPSVQRHPDHDGDPVPG